jgi:hypothetical protein
MYLCGIVEGYGVQSTDPVGRMKDIFPGASKGPFAKLYSFGWLTSVIIKPVFRPNESVPDRPVASWPTQGEKLPSPGTKFPKSEMP